MIREDENHFRTSSLSVNGNEGTLPEKSVLRSLSTGTLKYPDDERLYTFKSSDLQDLGLIGNGYFGTMYKMLHIESRRHIAVKRIRYNNIAHREQERILLEHDAIVKSDKCPNIVKFYGTIFSEGDCWICMELMDTSMHLLYKRVYEVKKSRLTENIIGHITVCTVDALDYLKKELNIIHHDVKPSNILVDGQGSVKLCNFGICGKLEESFANTNVGRQQYLAPERIASFDRYDVTSDVWSLGLTLYEIATGKFPDKIWSSPFEQGQAVMISDPPILKPNNENINYSLPLVKFVNSCLTKDKRYRPKYDVLKTFEFYQTYAKGGPIIQDAKMILGLEAIDTRDNPVDIRG